MGSRPVACLSSCGDDPQDQRAANDNDPHLATRTQLVEELKAQVENREAQVLSLESEVAVQREYIQKLEQQLSTCAAEYDALLNAGPADPLHPQQHDLIVVDYKTMMKPARGTFYYYVTYTLRNNANHDITGFKGTIAFIDSFGDVTQRHEISRTVTIRPGQTIVLPEMNLGWPEELSKDFTGTNVKHIAVFESLRILTPD